MVRKIAGICVRALWNSKSGDHYSAVFYQQPPGFTNSRVNFEKRIAQAPQVFLGLFLVFIKNY